MDSFFQQSRIDDLSAKLVRVRREKSALAAQIASSTTTPEIAEETAMRYTALIAELRRIEAELQQIRGKG